MAVAMGAKLIPSAVDRCCMLFLLAVASCVATVHGAEIRVGDDYGWTLGLKYGTIRAAPGDTVVFAWQGPYHNVWLLPSPKCDFTAATEVAGLTDSPYTFTVPAAGGQFSFGCELQGHCESGMLITVDAGGSGAEVPPAPPPAAAPPAEEPPPPPLAGVGDNADGYCDEPEYDGNSGEVFVHCISPPIYLYPGQVINANVLLPNPYPEGVEIAVNRTAADILDAEGRQVPLSDLYVHHWFGDPIWLPAEGAEYRGSLDRPPLPLPYHIIFNGSQLEPISTRYVNVHVINTQGVAPEDLQMCIECQCADNPATGGTGCCRDCKTSSTAGRQTYYLHLYTYYTVLEPGMDAEPVRLVTFDLAGDVEYDIPKQSPPNTTNVLQQVFQLDDDCPQRDDFGLTRCIAHLHIGGMCMSMYEADVSAPLQRGALICRSCSEYGTEKGVPGNELGYLVKISEHDLDPPYMASPGQKVVVVAEYNATIGHLGVMALWNMYLVGVDSSCPGRAPINITVAELLPGIVPDNYTLPQEPVVNNSTELLAIWPLLANAGEVCLSHLLQVHNTCFVGLKGYIEGSNPNFDAYECGQFVFALQAELRANPTCLCAAAAQVVADLDFEAYFLITLGVQGSLNEIVALMKQTCTPAS